MPELPEVETMVRDLRPEARGRTIVRATLLRDDVLKNRSRQTLVRHLRRATIADLTRRAKNAVFDLENRLLVIQPGMTGTFLSLTGEPNADDASRYDVLRLDLEGGHTVVYRDVRRLGRMYLFDRREWAVFTQAIGPEPFDDALTIQRFDAELSTSRQAIKKYLMDQRRLAGVGNIYANEALFAAGIDPSKPARRIGRHAAERLLCHVRRILAAAIEAEGTTFRDYRTGTGRPGNFQLELFVYGRENAPCKRCGTRLTGTHAIDSRITVFCHRCQS